MGTTGAPLNLTWPATGAKNWDASYVNANFSIINAAIAALQAGGATGPAGATGAAGAVGMHFAGQWNPVTNYLVTDVVTFNGSSYIALSANSNAEPDVNTNTWGLLAAAGAAGPAGPTGPPGPQGPSGAGSGQTVTFPITIAEGGTGATTAAAALTALGAAASGVNGDITQMVALQAVSAAVPAVTIHGPGAATAISWDDGVNGHAGGVLVNGTGYFTGIQVSGGILAGNLQASGELLCGLITAAVPNSTITIGSSGGSNCPVLINDGLTVQGTAPSCSAGQVSIGATTATTATAGPNGGLPAQVLGYLVWQSAGILIKIPFYGN